MYGALKNLRFEKDGRSASFLAYSKHDLKSKMNLFILLNITFFGINLENIEKDNKGQMGEHFYSFSDFNQL